MTIYLVLKQALQVCHAENHVAIEQWYNGEENNVLILNDHQGEPSVQLRRIQSEVFLLDKE